jgi:hypothetical protein
VKAVRAQRLLSALVASLSALQLAAPASADEPSDRHFFWRPSLQAQTVVEDDAHVGGSSQDGDVSFQFVPRVEAAWRTSAYELEADVAADLRRYTHEKTLNDQFVRAYVSGEAGLVPGLTLRISDAFVPQPVRLGVPEDATSNLLQTNRVEADVRYWRELSEGRELSIGLRGTRFNSPGFAALVPGPGGAPVVDPKFQANFWEGGGFLRFQNAVGKRSAFYLQGSARYRSFDQSSASDHTQGSMLLGFRTNFLRNFGFEIEGGAGVLDFSGGDRVPRFLGRAELLYRTTRGWRLALGLHNRFTADLAGNDFMDATGRLVVERFFGKRTAATLTTFVSLLDAASASPQRNGFGGVELVLRRQLTRRVQLGLSYRYWENAGSFAADDFQQNRVTFGLSYRH